MKFEPIEFMRKITSNVKVFECVCGKKFYEFDDWWNHGIIQNHFKYNPDEFRQILGELQI